LALRTWIQRAAAAIPKLTPAFSLEPSYVLVDIATPRRDFDSDHFR